MLMQEKMNFFSSDYRPASVGDYSPVVVAAAVNLCRNTSSPRPHLNPYECSKYMPLYYTKKIFNDFDKYSQLLAKPSLSFSSSTATVPYLAMQLPLRPTTLSKNLPVDIIATSPTATITSNEFNALPVKRTLDGTVKANEPENQRTQSVIMKVEDQRIVEIPTNELITTRTTTEIDEEANVCKWINCYR